MVTPTETDSSVRVTPLSNMTSANRTFIGMADRNSIYAVSAEQGYAPL